MKLNLTILYFLICTFFVLLITLGNVEKFQISAIFSVVIASTFFIAYTEILKLKPSFTEKSFFFKYSKKSNIIIVQILLIVFSLLNFYIVFGESDYEKINRKLNFDFKNIFGLTSIPLIITAQLGGWFYQTLSAYFLSVLLDVEISLKNLFKITGFAYIGFVLGAFIILILNTFVTAIPHDFEAANKTLSTSIIIIAISKGGDFLTSVLITYGILERTNESYKKAIIISFLPAVLLLSILQIMNK